MKILFAPLSNFLSHVTRLLCIADELKNRGHQTEFICSSEASDMIKKAGHKPNQAPEVDRNVMFQMGASKAYLARFRETSNGKINMNNHPYRLKEMMDADISIVKETNPDLIITDGRPVSHLCAWFMDIPCISVLNISGYISYSLTVRTE